MTTESSICNSSPERFHVVYCSGRVQRMTPMGWLMPAEKHTTLRSRTRRLPSDSTGRQYESETERQESIARQAEIREAVLAYQASCQTTYPEVNVDDYSALDRWWASVSRREKQKLAGAIRREKKRAKEWLAKHEAELPQEGDGRDSTNIQPYKYFHRHDTRDLGVDDNLNDQDGADIAQQSDKLEPSEHKDTGTMRDEEAARVYLGLATTLDKVTESFGETSRTSLVSSGTLRSSWSRIEKALGNYYDSNGKRKQWRGERRTPPLHVFGMSRRWHMTKRQGSSTQSPLRSSTHMTLRLSNRCGGELETSPSFTSRDSGTRMR
jgi:hypothetical protein